MTSTRSKKAPVMGACPTFFRALCHQASDGEGSYSEAARQLLASLSTLAPDHISVKAWGRRLANLSALVHSRNNDGVLAWFDSQLPRCMALVSASGRQAFLRGVYRVALDEGLDVFTA